MYIQGQFIENISLDMIADMPLSNSNQIADIIDALDELSVIWSVGGEYYNRAFDILSRYKTMSGETIKESLSYLPAIFSKCALEKRINSELGNIDSLDSFISQVDSNFKLLHSPVGKLLHITAGNVFLGAIDSLIMGLITKNTNIVKVGSRNDHFPLLFCESLKEVSNSAVLSDHICFLKWRGGDVDYESQISKYSDAIIIWGGQEVISSYRHMSQVSTKLIEFGPKLSFGVLDSRYLKQFEDHTLSGIARDVFTWNQSACSNAQTYFLHEQIDINSFLDKLYNKFLYFSNKELFIDQNSQVERLKEAQRVSFSNFKSNIKSYVHKDFIISYKDSDDFTLSVLNQTLNIRTFKDIDDLIFQIKDMKFYFQTCGLGVLDARNSYMNRLSRFGVKRFTDVGHMTLGTEGAPHDGQFPLRSLVNEVADETASNKDLAYMMLKEKMPIYNNDKNESINSNLIKSHQINKTDSLLSKDRSNGYYFTSGGSTGTPKYSYYSFDDLDRVASKLSHNFKELGLDKNDTVANLFMAGNLWSSFLSTQKVLESVGCNILPIGGSCEEMLTVKYLLDFKANVITGIPTKILSLARYVLDNNLSCNLKIIFYAGERFSKESLRVVQSAFNCDNIRSAGFATVDCGLIGVQTQDCEQDEHILLDEVKIYSKGDKQFISSSLRENMPVVDYQLDDKLIFDSSNSRKFKLAGRTDKLIQIWGCRFTDSDIVESTGQNGDSIQVRVTRDEKLVIISSQVAIAPEIFTQSFICKNLDVRSTVSKDFLLENISFEVRALDINIKTGKTPLVIDERF